MDAANPTWVAGEVQSIYLELFPEGDPLFVTRSFGWANDCFHGARQGYQAVDARYHDFQHTLQGVLCMARLLHRRKLAGAEPVISQSVFEMGILAILLHDTGYLKERDDTEGTGAKYTLIHVDRSTQFARNLLAEKGFSEKQIQTVQNMIHCTGVQVALDQIPFSSQEERIVGYALGTADLLGQMAASDYVQKLPVLFEEFDEALKYQQGKMSWIGLFSSAEDLLRKTPIFWEKSVLPRLENQFGGLYRYLSCPYPDGRNEYLERIESNIARLRGLFHG